MSRHQCVNNNNKAAAYRSVPIFYSQRKAYGETVEMEYCSKVDSHVSLTLPFQSVTWHAVSIDSRTKKTPNFSVPLNAPTTTVIRPQLLSRQQISYNPA